MNTEIAEYRIVSNHDIGCLAKAVSECIKHGWVPQGGVALGQGGFPMQAMVKYNSPN